MGFNKNSGRADIMRSRPLRQARDGGRTGAVVSVGNEDEIWMREPEGFDGNVEPLLRPQFSTIQAPLEDTNRVHRFIQTRCRAD